MKNPVYLNIPDPDSMSLDPTYKPGPKVIVVNEREKLAAENRRSDVRRFLDACDIDQLVEIYEDMRPERTAGELTELIMEFDQSTIDKIWRNEGLNEPETPEEEKAL